MSSPMPSEDDRTTSNPFAAPKTSSTDFDPSGRPSNFGDATAGQRFANFLIDYVCIQIFSFMFGVVYGVLFGESSWAFVSGLFAMYIYYALLEGLTGRTVGKLVTGTKVIDESGGPPSIGTVLVRSIIRYVPFEAFSLLGGDARGWHDDWSRTRVVRLRPNKFEAGM